VRELFALVIEQALPSLDYDMQMARAFLFPKIAKSSVGARVKSSRGFIDWADVCIAISGRGLCSFAFRFVYAEILRPPFPQHFLLHVVEFPWLNALQNKKDLKKSS